MTKTNKNQLDLAKAVLNNRSKVLFPSLAFLFLGLGLALFSNDRTGTFPLLFILPAAMGIVYFLIDFSSIRKNDSFTDAQKLLKQEKSQIKKSLTDDRQHLKSELNKVLAAKKAQRAVQRVEKAHDGDIRDVERSLENLLDEKGKKIISLGGVTLFERYIVSPQGSGSIVGMHASAEDNTSISKRFTATRMLAFGVFALAVPKKKGIGHAYVVFEGPDLAGVATIEGTKNQAAGPQAAMFAAAINNAARSASEWLDSKPEEESRLRKTLAKLGATEVGTSEKTAFKAAISLVNSEMKARHFDA